MEKSCFLIIGCREPERLVSQQDTDVSDSAETFYCGWTGSGWGPKHKHKDMAWDDAKRYGSDLEALADRDLAQRDAEKIDPLMRAVLTRENTDEEGWSNFVEYP